MKKHKTKMLSVLCILGIHYCNSQNLAPDIVASAGGSASNASCSLNWTIGEPIIETGNSNSAFLTQGFQQPSNIIIASVDNTSNSTGINVYPNPFQSSISIKTNNNESLLVQIMDMAGKVLVNRNLQSKTETLNLEELASGMYLCKVYGADNKLLRTLKLTKVN
jgi:hypothetical protein